MEGLHNNFTAPNPPTEVARRSVGSNNNMDPSFISLSLITDDDILEEFNTVNETILDDYSQASTAALSISQEPDVSQMVTRISESPVMANVLNTQLSAEPDSNLNLSRPSPSSPSADTEVIEDDDVLPASPVLPNQLRRTPVSLSRSSAFVTMAIGSPVQGSLRTLRNIEEMATSTVPDKSDSSSEANEATAKSVLNVETLGSPSKSKSMRQIHFESDSGSNQSVVESPSSFLSEPNRGLDNSIQKPTVNRPADPFEEADDGIEFVEEIKRKVRGNSCSPQSSMAIPAGQPKREADSASQNLTPRLTQSQSSIPFSQDLLSTSPLRDPDSQSHRFIECFQTQDLIPRNEPSLDETVEQEEDASSEIISSKLELSAELYREQSPSREVTKDDTRSAATSLNNNHVENRSEEDAAHGTNDTTDPITSQEDAPEAETEQWEPFEAVHRLYNSRERTWTIWTYTKMVPSSKMETVMSGSVIDKARIGLFDSIESETLPGSRLESFIDLLQRHVSQSSSGYNADISASYKSDSGSLRMSRFSIASSFEPAPIACSSMLTQSSRASLEPPSMPSSSEFAMPRNPVRQKATCSANGDQAKPSVPSSQSKEDGAGPLPSQHSLYPDSTEVSSAVDPAAQSDKDISKPKEGEQAADAFTGLKTGVRKRGRKPKIPEMIKEVESSTDTPPKKRRGRPPSDGTPAKKKSSANDKKQEPQKKSSDANQPSGSGATDSQNRNEESGSDKSSEDYLREVEEVWREGRQRSYEIGKPVFAQWTDKYYYAAKIVKRDSVQTGKWAVLFEDGRSRSLVEEFILPVSLLNKKQPILVLNENLGEGRPGVVVGYSKTKSLDEMEHLVEMDGCANMKVPRIRICLTQDNMKHLSDSIVVPQLFSPHTCNVSLDNILGGKRRRATTAELASSSPQTPRHSRTPRSRSETPAVGPDQTPKRSVQNTGSLRKSKTKGKRDLTLDTSTMSESSGTASVLLHEETSLRTRILDRMNAMQSDQPTVQNEVEEEKKHNEEETKEVVDLNIAGPIPENNQLFAGYCFLLTKATRPLEVDPENVTDELEPYLDPTPYYKEYIRKQLTAGGGTVLERFDQSQVQTDGDTVLMVCNRPCRTERYIRSLAANIRAVSHDWVYQCCKKNELFNYQRYLQPPGIDLQGNIVEWSPTTGRCFVGTRILLHGPPQFNDLWVPILLQAECTIVSRFPARSSKNDPEGSNGDNAQSERALCDDVPFDYVVTTKDCPANIVDQARRMKIPLVSSLWVIQSLIHGKILDPSSNLEFNFKYTKP